MNNKISEKMLLKTFIEFLDYCEENEIYLNYKDHDSILSLFSEFIMQ